MNLAVSFIYTARDNFYLKLIDKKIRFKEMFNILISFPALLTEYILDGNPSKINPDNLMKCQYLNSKST